MSSSVYDRRIVGSTNTFAKWQGSGSGRGFVPRGFMTAIALEHVAKNVSGFEKHD